MWNSDCGFLLNCEGEFWEKMKGLSSVVHCDGVRKQPSSLLTWETALVRKTSQFKQSYSWTPKVVTYCCDCALKSLAPFFFLKVVWKLLRVEERGVNCGSSLSHLGSGKWLSTWKPSRTKLGDKETQLGHPQLKPATCTSSERASCSQLALHLACGVWQNRNVECVYKVAVIAEICQHRCLRKFQRIEVNADSGHPPWTAGVNPGEETGLRARNQGPAEWQSRGGCSPSPSPYSALPLDLAPSPLLLCARMTQDRDCLFAWRNGCFLPLHPRWLQVRTWLKLLRRAVWAATEWHWGVLGPRAPWHLLWAASGKQSAYILTSFRWLAGVSLSGRANASLRIFILFTFPTFFFSRL